MLSESCSRDSMSSQPSCTALNYSYGVNAWKYWVQAKYAGGETSKAEELRFGRKCPAQGRQGLWHCWASGCWKLLQELRKPACARPIPAPGPGTALCSLPQVPAAETNAAFPTAKPMRIKEDILACTAAELNYGLAQFVKEITRPNGERYEPDSIYYLCLGIQQVRWPPSL